MRVAINIQQVRRINLGVDLRRGKAGMAEKLLGEWSRPILKRTDDYKKRYVEMRDFNPE